MNLTDEQLILLCKQSDDSAFQELVHRYTKSIFIFTYRYTRSVADTEDIAQETFLKAWKHIHTFKSGSSFKVWLYTIARNTALDCIKKRRIHVFSDLESPDDAQSFSETLLDTELLPTELFEQNELYEKLTKILEKIHPNYHDVITLHYQQDLTFEEISKILDTPMNTVKSWHRRALIKIREAMHQNTSIDRI